MHHGLQQLCHQLRLILWIGQTTEVGSLKLSWPSFHQIGFQIKDTWDTVRNQWALQKGWKKHEDLIKQSEMPGCNLTGCKDRYQHWTAGFSVNKYSLTYYNLNNVVTTRFSLTSSFKFRFSAKENEVHLTADPPSSHSCEMNKSQLRPAVTLFFITAKLKPLIPYISSGAWV